MNKDDFLYTALIQDFDPIQVSQSDLDKTEILFDENDMPSVVIHEGIAYQVQVSEVCDQCVEIIVDGRSFEVQLKRPVDLLTDKLGFGKRKAADQQMIIAPMPGNVLHVEVVSGQEVKNGDTILTLEAMKMENVVQTSLDGTIKSVHVQKGQKVTKGQILVEIE